MITAAQLAEMDPRWIERRVSLEIVDTELRQYRGPRFDRIWFEDRASIVGAKLLRWSCKPWYFPHHLKIYHAQWFDDTDGSVFHRMRLDQPIDGWEGDAAHLEGALRIDARKGCIYTIYD